MSTQASQPAVVLLPWVPATAISRRPCAASATTCCHASRGMPARYGGAQLGVVRVDRRQRLRDRKAVGWWPHADVCRTVGPLDGDPRTLEGRRVGRRPARIAARDECARRLRVEGGRRRAGTGDPDDVDALAGRIGRAGRAGASPAPSSAAVRVTRPRLRRARAATPARRAPPRPGSPRDRRRR